MMYDHMAAYGYGYGYGGSGLLGWLLVFLTKILMVVLVLAVIVGIVIWIKNTFFIGNSQFMQSINNDPVMKTISVITIAILGIVLISALFSGLAQPGFGAGFGMGFGFNPAFSLAGLLMLLVKVLVFILVVSLILAGAAYLKNQYDSGNLNFFGNQNNTGQ
ncbi:MAG: hypothetical protein ACM3PP_08215 [Candidatus Saccharibacteria bacterium]